MDTGEFPNFNTGIYTGCNFRQGEIHFKNKKMRRENLPERNFTARNVLEAVLEISGRPVVRDDQKVYRATNL